MTTKKLPPLFSDAAVDAPRFFDGRYIRDTYEEARAKDAERIEQLEELARKMGNGLVEMFRPANIECDGPACMGCWKDIQRNLINELKAAGFTPSEP